MLAEMLYKWLSTTCCSAVESEACRDVRSWSSLASLMRKARASQKVSSPFGDRSS